MNENSIGILYEEALQLLRELIATPSFSKEEDETAGRIASFLKDKGISCERLQHNVWAKNLYHDASKPTILLNSHHDTVKPNSGYTRDPFSPDIVDGKLYGLGSNDAGGCLVSLLATFCYFYDKKELPYNFIFAATAEEEISGKNGLESILSRIGKIEFAVVGEPTQMQLAVAEKGLMVVDAVVKGLSGHAAREEGKNAIYMALDDLNWIRDYRFQKISPHLGEMKMTATIIQAGAQHNVVPDRCQYTLDIRLTEAYTMEEVMQILGDKLQAELQPRSMRLKPSYIPEAHPFVQAGLSLNRQTYGSPTTSDQAVIPEPSVKLGPGDSARSHTADEFIYTAEIKEGIQLYIQLFETMFRQLLMAGNR